MAQDSRQQAIEYLREQLGPRAPRDLHPAGVFNEQPLEGEAETALFSFDLDVGTEACATPEARRHYVAVGQTTPNYFPSFGLAPDDAYSLHIGTRFMLEMEVQRVDPADEPPGARQYLEQVIRDHAPGAAASPPELAALFRFEEGFFAVYRVDVEGRSYYAMGADCPPGFYELTQHPPQTALRLHLGKLIRAEARAASER